MGDKTDAVVVTPEEAASVAENTSEDDNKPKKKKKKNKDKKSDESAIEQMDTTSTEDVSETPKKKKVKHSEKVNEIQTESVISQETKPKNEKGSHVRSARERMKADFSYISSFLGAIHIPQHKKIEEDILDDDHEDGETMEEKEKRVKPGETTRADTREELKERLQSKLQELRGNKTGDSKKAEKKLKKKLAKVEKKKKEAEELKQKLMTVGRNAGKKGNLLKGAEDLGATAVKKPGIKTEKGVVFSKFDFKDEMNTKKEVKKNLDPQAALTKIKKSKEKIKMWEEKGRSEKASKIENNIAWENAIGKAQGEKVKDDVTLLKKSIKKQKQIKSSNKKKWDKRSEEIKSKETAFVEKREGNLNKRIKEKKEKKMKKLVAKGRHVPGF